MLASIRCSCPPAGPPTDIVVVAIGANKAPVVIEAVKLGVHELLIDIDLAEALREHLRQL